jgi:peptidoglycan-N-acetylglucosamine deacetylase
MVLGVALAVAVAVAGVLTSGAARTRARARAHRTLLAGLYPVQSRAARAQRRLGRAPAPVPVASGEIRRLLALGLPIYCGGRRGNEVAFTFDDGPGPYTYLALKKLRQAHERATFFVVGKSINAYHGYLPRELKLAAIGDHTYTHPDLVALAPTQVLWQLRATAALIQAQSGERVELFRPPYEAHDPTVDRIARQLGLLEVLWSVDSRDWFGADLAQIIKNVEGGLRPGAIVLMHENHGQTIRALTTLLPALHRRHLRSVSVPELLAADPPSVAQVRRGLAGCGEPPHVAGALGGG